MQRIQNSQNNFKTKAGVLICLNFKTYSKATVLKIMWSWHKDGHKDQWSRIGNPETDPHSYDSGNWFYYTDTLIREG